MDLPKPKREIRYIARCKTCKTATSGLTRGYDVNKPKALVTPGEPYSYHSPENVGVAWGAHVLDCRTCGKPLAAKPVRGTFKASVACNAKCMASVGTTCECSCGGKNHGASHSNS